MTQMYVIVRTNLDNPDDFGFCYNNNAEAEADKAFIYTSFTEAKEVVTDLQRMYSNEQYKIYQLSGEIK